jgi:hypothetical protein
VEPYPSGCPTSAGTDRSKTECLSLCKAKQKLFENDIKPRNARDCGSGQTSLAFWYQASYDFEANRNKAESRKRKLNERKAFDMCRNSGSGTCVVSLVAVRRRGRCLM